MPECRTCEAHVSKSYARVFGVDGTVERCHNCDIHGRVSDGSAAGRSVEYPDPLEHPERDVDVVFLDENGEPRGSRSGATVDHGKIAPSAFVIGLFSLIPAYALAVVLDATVGLTREHAMLIFGSLFVGMFIGVTICAIENGNEEEST